MAQDRRNCALTAAFCLFLGVAIAEDMMLSVNVKKPVAVVSDRFLSVTIDPVVLFNSDLLSDAERATSMAKALSPAYVRIGGPRSNSYVFERNLYPQEAHPDPGYTFSENHWIQVHQWAGKSGLDIIACIAPQQSDSSSNARYTSWDPRNALDLISFSDHMGYNTSWQLGYECQTRCDVSGSDLARDVQRLRGMLDAFPRYAEGSLIAGPDVVTYKTRQQQQYLQEYFSVASGSLSAVTWHPDFASVSLESEGVSMHYDNLAMDKDSFYRIAGRYIMKKPLWLAESRPEDCKGQFLGALVWVRRLGNSAKLGIQVLMRQPVESNLFKPTPDYWVSMLHKMLVGREVLDTRIAAGNRTHVNFYCQCTRPSSRYEKGSLTVFGINLTPTKVTASLKGLKLKVVHKYILLPGYDAPNRMFAETVLLNNELLSLIDGKEVPDVQPAIASTEKGVKLKLPSGGIGFWVLPGLKIKTCMGHEEDMAEKNMLKKISKRLEDVEIDEGTELEDDNREAVDLNSTEDRKLSLKQQQLLFQKRQLSRRNTRHRDDERDEQDERKIRRFDAARHDFDRMDRVVRRRDHHAVNQKSGGYHGVFVNSDEEENNNSEEGIIRKLAIGQKLDSGEVIRTKLEEYKKRLADYENRKKNRELTENLDKERFTYEQPDSANKGMDTEKVIEALTLITKVESAMKGLEKIDDIEVQPVQATVPTLNASNSNDVTAGLPQTSTNSFNRGDDMLLDEVLNTEKAKRTSIPSRIEDQLKALYRLLSEEKDRREAQSVQRRRRDLDKSIGADPLGLHRDRPFLRKRAKGEDGKDRPVDRKSERRQRLREKLDLRREKDEQRRDSRDSIENNFYGFQYREPLKNFPEGDVYLQTADSSTEEKDPITVYTSDVVENKPKLERSKNSFNLLPTATVQPVQDEHEDLWLEEGESNHMPNEFYENVKPQGFNAKNNLKNYGEVGEAEALPKNGEIEKHVEEPADYVHHDIVTERPLTELENRQAKEKAVQQLVNYYAPDPNQNRPYAFEQNQQPMYFQQPPVLNFLQVPMVEKNDPYFAEQNRYMNQDRFYVNPNPFIPPGQIPYQRVKRHINNLEDVLRQEMISQDDNNLRDCQCRVIRGEEECKDCIQEESHSTAPSSPNSLAGARKSAIYNHSNGIRYRRDIEAVEGTYDPAELSVIETGAPDEVVVVPASLEEHIEIENPLNGEVNEEDLIEAKDIEEAPPIGMEYQMQLEDAGDEQLPGNRLPRKTDTASKFFRNAKQSVTNSPAKEDPRSSRQNINSFANNFSTSSRPYIVSSTEAVKTYPTVIRPVEDATTQAQSTTSPKATSQIYKEVTEQKQPFRVESATITNIETNAKSISKKSTGTGSSAEDKGKDGTKNINTKGKSGQGTGDKNTVAPLLTTSAVVKNTTATKSKSQTLKNVKKINTTNAEPKNKTKYNNNSGKMDEIMKTRQARLTTRAEALAALRKENESRRTKKMIEASLKIIDTENAKFAEFQRRRQDQLERLKRKLRAKREKILEQYREELLEAINESSDPKERTLRRRDLLQKYQAANDESRKSDMINDQDKLAYIMRYRPLKFGPEKDGYKPSEDRRYVSAAVVDLIRPYQESKRKHVLERNEARINNDYDNDEYETNRDKKLGMHLDSQFISEQLYDTSNEHNDKSTNRKRSPFTLIDKPEPLNEHNLKSPVPLEGDSGEFYSQLHPEYEAELHPTISYEEDIPLHVKYNQPLQDSHQQPLEQLEKQPLALDQENPHDINAPNVPQQDYLNYYGIDHEHIQHPYNEYYNPNQENVQQTPPVMNNFGVPPHGDIVEHLPLAPNYPKSKRSSLKVLEIDPSIFEEYEPEYNMQELFMRPSSRFSSRSYRHYPHGYANRRYRRQTLNKAHDDGPLSFSLSLEKSKNKQKKATITAPLAELIRTKRITDGDSINKSKAYVENKSTINKNIKKVYKTAYDLKYKKLIVKPKYARLLENKSLKPINAVRQEYCEISEPFDNISTKIKTLDPNNIINEDENRESLLKRSKRSFNENYNDYEITKANKINHLEDPEINQILKNIVEMEQDEALLHEYDRQNNDIIKNFRESQLYFKDYMESTVSPGEDITKTTTKIFESTTQANIESMLVDAIPKLENVITGGLVKAQNITGSLEDFIENLDDQFSSVTENSRNDTESAASTEENDGRISHSVFQSMVGSVKKFFTLVSGIAKIFHGY